MIYFDGIISQLQNSGGVTVYFQEILQRLARDRIPFQIGTYADARVLDRIDNETRHACQFHKKTRILERFRRAPVSDAATVFHSTYYRRPQRNTVPTVVTVHDFTYERLIGGLRQAVHSQQKHSAIRHANLVVCVSESTRRDLLEFVQDCDPAKVHVVHNGVGETFRVLSDRPEGTGQSRPYVLFVGARAGYKNFDLAVRIVARLAEHDLVAVGGGALNKAERDLIASHLPEERFRHVGFVSEETLNTLYNGADFLLYPSSYEGFGIPVLEAMKAGCPVVAINVSSIPEVAGPAGYLADAAHEEALWAVTDRLLHDSAERKRRVATGVQWSKNFSWESTYQKTASIYADAKAARN